MHYIKNTKSLFHRGVCSSWENLGRNPPSASKLDCIILRKRVVKQAVGGAEGSSELVAIPNRYKDTLDDLMDSSDTKSPDRPGPIDKGSRNAPRFEGSSMGLSEKDCLNEDVLNRSSGLTPKTGDFQVHQRLDVALLVSKAEEHDMERVRGVEKMGSQRGGEDGKGERGGKGRQGNKINPVVGGNSGSEASGYHHIIYGC